MSTETVMTDEEILQRMLELLSAEEQWTKRSYERECEYASKQHCLVGAYMRAAGVPVTGEAIEDLFDAVGAGRTPSLLTRLRQVIDEQYMEHGAHYPGVPDRIIAFNDAVLTKFEHVRVVLEKAAAHE